MPENPVLDLEGLQYYNDKLNNFVSGKIKKIDSKINEKFDDADHQLSAINSRVDEIENNKVDKEEGFGLSELNFTRSDKEKLDLAITAVSWDDVQNKPDFSSVYDYRGSVPSYSDLPITPDFLKVGYVYNVEDTGMNYAWTGENWDALGMVLDIATITPEEIDDLVASIF